MINSTSLTFIIVFLLIILGSLSVLRVTGTTLLDEEEEIATSSESYQELQSDTLPTQDSL